MEKTIRYRVNRSVTSTGKPSYDSTVEITCCDLIVLVDSEYKEYDIEAEILERSDKLMEALKSRYKGE